AHALVEADRVRLCLPLHQRGAELAASPARMREQPGADALAEPVGLDPEIVEDRDAIDGRDERCPGDWRPRNIAYENLMRCEQPVEVEVRHPRIEELVLVAPVALGAAENLAQERRLAQLTPADRKFVSALAHRRNHSSASKPMRTTSLNEPSA